MTISHKVLLVENQKKQFDLIRESLIRNSIDVLPTEEQFSVFLSWVRIALNNRYKAPRQLEATEKIHEFIAKNNVALAIIDHNLIGMALSAQNGIDLAIEISSRKQTGSLPFLFLSRTQQSDKSVMSMLRKLKDFSGSSFEWMSKGYDTDLGLSAKYIEEEVIPCVQGLIEKGGHEIFISYIKDVIGKEGLEGEPCFETLKTLAGLRPGTLDQSHFDLMEKMKKDSKNNSGVYRGSDVENALHQCGLFR